jgi:non-canonical (house-cleaning) NTP pyrophosphatase
MVVGIASIRKPKVEAVKAVFARLAPRLAAGTTGEGLVFLEFEIDSSAEETPTSLERLLQGAKARGQNLREHCRERQMWIEIAVGLEGGLFSIERESIGRLTFLQSWAYVTSDGRESFGASGAIQVPPSIAHPVLDEHQSLSDVIDRIALQNGIRSNQGTWGVLSQDLISRQASFEMALTSALAPFYNPAMYTGH